MKTKTDDHFQRKYAQMLESGDDEMVESALGTLLVLTHAADLVLKPAEGLARALVANATVCLGALRLDEVGNDDKERRKRLGTRLERYLVVVHNLLLTETNGHNVAALASVPPARALAQLVVAAATWPANERPSLVRAGLAGLSSMLDAAYLTPAEVQQCVPALLRQLGALSLDAVEEATALLCRLTATEAALTSFLPLDGDGDADALVQALEALLLTVGNAGAPQPGAYDLSAAGGNEFEMGGGGEAVQQNALQVLCHMACFGGSALKRSIAAHTCVVAHCLGEIREYLATAERAHYAAELAPAVAMGSKAVAAAPAKAAAAGVASTGVGDDDDDDIDNDSAPSSSSGTSASSASTMVGAHKTAVLCADTLIHLFGDLQAVSYFEKHEGLVWECLAMCDGSARGAEAAPRLAKTLADILCYLKVDV